MIKIRPIGYLPAVKSNPTVQVHCIVVWPLTGQPGTVTSKSHPELPFKNHFQLHVIQSSQGCFCDMGQDLFVGNQVPKSSDKKVGVLGLHSAAQFSFLCLLDQSSKT